MGESNGSGQSGTGTAEIPVIRPGATAPVEQPAPAPVQAAKPVEDDGPAATENIAAPGAHETAPVTVRPAPRMPRRGPLTVMGPWAPVAGAALGLLLGIVVVVLLAG